jgi:hypothetical protein
MILDKEIQVNITSVNLKYYRNLEYDVKVGDKIKIYYVSNSTINTNSLYNSEMDGSDTFEGIQTDILAVIPASPTQGQRIIINVETTISQEYETTGKAELVYHRLVQYF